MLLVITQFINRSHQRVWMHGRLSFICTISMYVKAIFDIVLCVGNLLVADLPLKFPFHHNTAIVEEQTMPARYNMRIYEDIKWKLCTSAKPRTAASNVHLPFSPIVSRCLSMCLSLWEPQEIQFLFRTGKIEIFLGHIWHPFLHLKDFVETKMHRIRKLCWVMDVPILGVLCWVQQVKNGSHIHTWKPSKTLQR